MSKTGGLCNEKHGLGMAVETTHLYQFRIKCKKCALLSSSLRGSFLSRMSVFNQTGSASHPISNPMATGNKAVRAGG
jgi:hypothetical protein